jgi:hypothetical protein
MTDGTGRASTVRPSTVRPLVHGESTVVFETALQDRVTAGGETVC